MRHNFDASLVTIHNRCTLGALLATTLLLLAWVRLLRLVPADASVPKSLTQLPTVMWIPLRLSLFWIDLASAAVLATIVVLDSECCKCLACIP